jgi:hypothetical protein
MMDEMLARMWVCEGDAAGSWSLTFALNGFGGAKQGYVLEGFVDIGGSRHAFEGVVPTATWLVGTIFLSACLLRCKDVFLSTDGNPL